MPNPPESTHDETQKNQCKKNNVCLFLFLNQSPKKSTMNTELTQPSTLVPTNHPDKKHIQRLMNHRNHKNHRTRIPDQTRTQIRTIRDK